MSAIAIQNVTDGVSIPHFRAAAGSYEAVGRTAGEALDSLLAKEGQSIESSTILIQRFAPDIYFTQAQHDRMTDLLDRRGSLSDAETAELDELIDVELDATVTRAEAVMKPRSR